MIRLASQRKNLATLLEALSATRHIGTRVWWKMGKGRAITPKVAPHILIWIRWQVSEDRVIASLVACYIGGRM